MYKNGLITTIWNWCRTASPQFHRQKLLTASDTTHSQHTTTDDDGNFFFYSMRSETKISIYEFDKLMRKHYIFHNVAQYVWKMVFGVQFMSQMWQVIQDLWTSNEYACIQRMYICLISSFFSCDWNSKHICDIYMCMDVLFLFASVYYSVCRFAVAHSRSVRCKLAVFGVRKALFSFAHVNKFPSENMLRMNEERKHTPMHDNWKFEAVHSVRCDCMTGETKGKLFYFNHLHFFSCLRFWPVHLFRSILHFDVILVVHWHFIFNEASHRCFVGTLEFLRWFPFRLLTFCFPIDKSNQTTSPTRSYSRCCMLLRPRHSKSENGNIWHDIYFC